MVLDGAPPGRGLGAFGRRALGAYRHWVLTAHLAKAVLLISQSSSDTSSLLMTMSVTSTHKQVLQDSLNP
jgi:hypothetical protein